MSGKVMAALLQPSSGYQEQGDNLSRYLYLHNQHDAAKTLRFINNEGSCAVHGIDPEQSGQFQQDIERLAERAYGLGVLVVASIETDDEPGDPFDTFQVIEDSLTKSEAENLIIFRDGENLFGTTRFLTPQQELAGLLLQDLLRSNPDTKICILSTAPEDSFKPFESSSHALGQIATHISFTGVKETPVIVEDNGKYMAA